MSGPPPAVAATRVAVRRCLADLDPAEPVGVALSGGADSLALLAATAFERPAVTALVVDQHWHAGSTAQCARAAGQARAAGADAVVLDAPSDRDEAAARESRYAVIEKAAADRGLAAVLLGHTADDQAETVLLALLRGSGARSLAGMPPRRGILRRPFLALGRATTRQACADGGLEPYDDPANADDAFVRTRVRALTAALGRDVTANLVRTADLLRADADLLDALASATDVDHPDGGLDAAALADLPSAIRTRLLHRLAPGLAAAHVRAADALVTDWHGQGAVALPGGDRLVRRSGRIAVVPEARRSTVPSPGHPA